MMPWIGVLVSAARKNLLASRLLNVRRAEVIYGEFHTNREGNTDFRSFAIAPPANL